MKCFSLFLIYFVVNIWSVSGKPQGDQLPGPLPPAIQKGFTMVKEFFSIFGDAFNTMWNIIPRFMELFKSITGDGAGGGTGGTDGISSMLPNIANPQMPLSLASDQINEISFPIQSPF